MSSDLPDQDLFYTSFSGTPGVTGGLPDPKEVSNRFTDNIYTLIATYLKEHLRIRIAEVSEGGVLGTAEYIGESSKNIRVSLYLGKDLIHSESFWT